MTTKRYESPDFSGQYLVICELLSRRPPAPGMMTSLANLLRGPVESTAHGGHLQGAKADVRDGVLATVHVANESIATTLARYLSKKFKE